MIRTTFILALVFFSVTGAFGQGRPEWIGRSEDTIKLKEPQWKFGKRMVSDDSDHYSESIRLTKGGVTGNVEIFGFTVITNPIETFHGHVTIKDNLSGPRTTKTKLEGLGDEGYMWASSDPNAHATVYFMKGKTYVTVYLPGKVAAQRIAKYFADQMP